MGTAELACASLRALAESGSYDVCAVVTQPDRPKGRELKLQPSPVKQMALERGFEVLQPLKARAPEFLAQLKNVQPDLIVVAAYGQILPQSILDLPAHGCLNVHTSLLPRYRGAAPIQWALLNGDSETGVTIMQMDAGMDTGDILTQRRTMISDADNAATLHDRLAVLGAELLLETIPKVVTGQIQRTPQSSEQASHARKITKADGHIEWSLSARSIWNRIRGFTPWPGAYTFQTNEASRLLLKIWQASPMSGSGPPGEIIVADKHQLIVACGEGALDVQIVQPEGRRRMTAVEFMAGHALGVGSILS